MRGTLRADSKAPNYADSREYPHRPDRSDHFTQRGATKTGDVCRAERGCHTARRN